MLQRWKIVVEYMGIPFNGWQRQEEGVPSVQLAIEDALHAFCQRRITVHAAGRTDAGVHARGQVAHFDLDYGARDLTGFRLASALNAHLTPLPVAILSAEPVDDEFHARFSATNKLYCYRILNRHAPPTVDAGQVWAVRQPLDVDAMREAAKHLVGKHDFTTFRDSECQAKTPIRTLDRLEIESASADTEGGLDIRLWAEARSFLHHQVRNMAGTLVQAGLGRWTPEDVKAALEAKDRRAGGPTAPPEGLYLMRVDYAQ